MDIESSPGGSMHFGPPAVAPQARPPRPILARLAVPDRLPRLGSTSFPTSETSNADTPAP
jgi:hypothetical protein